MISKLRLPDKCDDESVSFNGQTDLFDALALGIKPFDFYELLSKVITMCVDLPFMLAAKTHTNMSSFQHNNEDLHGQHFAVGHKYL